MHKTVAFPASFCSGIWSKIGLSADKLERLRDLAVAGAISLALLLVFMLDPVDQFIWINQSKLSNQNYSGDVVFVSTEPTITDPSVGSYRSDLAQALRQLEKDGAKKIYIDLVFSSPSTPNNDEDLSDAIAELGDKVVLVDQLSGRMEESGELTKTIDSIGKKANRAISRRWVNYFGLIWTREFSHVIENKTIPSLAGSLAGVDGPALQSFNIDYGFSSKSILSIPIEDILQGRPSAFSREVFGKTVVIGAKSSQTNSTQQIPGDYAAPYSYISIYAAESIKTGRTEFINAWISLLYPLILLTFSVFAFQAILIRRAIYVVLIISFPALLYFGIISGIRIEISYSIVLAVGYLLVRSRTHWRTRIRLFDLETGLPKLSALTAMLARIPAPHGYIVVARIHGYENVLKTLEKAERKQYVMRLIDRVRAADNDLVIYFEGHNFAWHVTGEDADALKDHLEGLRAIFAAPIAVADKSIDVGISFGVARNDGDGEARLAAALAAAEESSEAEHPIQFAPDTSRSDELWDISMRARIDEAMKAGEVYCVYQPKIDIRTGLLQGVEALVRWQDPERGFISPMKFIAQCEKAGRMEHLTRYVLQCACNAGRLLHFRGRDITMSVNISATLLSDMRVVNLVKSVLQSTGYPPDALILEITETSRIGDHATAAAVLGEIKALGAAISIDDFGVGAANFETFYQLPFDELKIDRMFVAEIANNRKARAICASIVSLGAEARVKVVAEGVEDTKTLELLAEIGCHTAQGFALSRPMSISNLLNLKDLWKVSKKINS